MFGNTFTVSLRVNASCTWCATQAPFNTRPQCAFPRIAWEITRWLCADFRGGVLVFSNVKNIDV